MGPCDKCKKAQATFHLTNLEQHSIKEERHLCERCATEEGLLPSDKPVLDLSHFMEQFVTGGKASAAAQASLVCEECGMTYIEFRNQGVLGCPHDYDVFAEPLAKLLESAHDGATHHVGKSPHSLGNTQKPADELRRLRRLLDEAVTGEDYERAASLRDRIREIESA